jgi:NAD(P)-dependent dehydrogenase (short-subunit alcohol dehydrogenase family)
VALPFLGPYAASKFAMEGLTDSLRRELRPLGTTVSLVRPGPIATSIWERGNAAADAVIGELPPEALQLYGDGIRAARAGAETRAREAIPPEAVAEVVAHALTADKPRTRYAVGPRARAMAVFSRLLPDRAFDLLVSRYVGW